MNDITYVGLDVHKATVCVANVFSRARTREVRVVKANLSLGATTTAAGQLRTKPPR